jgi:hypothetical protein
MAILQATQSPHSIGLPPNQPQGVRALGPYTIPFQTQVTGQNVVVSFSDDLIVENEDGSINNIQSLYFDNMANFFDVAFTMQDTGQTLYFPAKTCGYLPVMTSNTPRYYARIYGLSEAQQSTPFVVVTFFNTPVQPCVYSSVSTGAPYAFSVAASNTGNAALGLNILNGGVLQTNLNMYITGIGIVGSGATVEGQGSATLTGMAISANGSVGNMLFYFDVPAIGQSVNFVRTFDPPLRAYTGPLSGAHPPGFVTTQPVLTVAAFGSGNTFMGCDVQYYVK